MSHNRLFNSDADTVNLKGVSSYMQSKYTKKKRRRKICIKTSRGKNKRGIKCLPKKISTPERIYIETPQGKKVGNKKSAPKFCCQNGAISIKRFRNQFKVSFLLIKVY